MCGSKERTAREIEKEAKECVEDALAIADKATRNGGEMTDDEFAALLYATNIVSEKEIMRHENANILIMAAICAYAIATFITQAFTWQFVAMMSMFAIVEIVLIVLSSQARKTKTKLLDAQDAALERELARARLAPTPIIEFPVPTTLEQQQDPA